MQFFLLQNNLFKFTTQEHKLKIIWQPLETSIECQKSLKGMVQSWTWGEGLAPPTSPGARGYIDANNLLCKRALIFRASRSIKIRIKGMNCVLSLERGDLETLGTRCESTVLYPHMMIYIYIICI